MQKKDNEYWKERFENLATDHRAAREKLAELKQENADLQKKLKQKTELFDAIPAGVVLIQNGKIIEINAASLKGMGHSKEAVIGRKFLDFVHPKTRSFEKNLYKKRVSGKWIPDEYETDLIGKNGEAVCCEIKVRKIRFNGRTAFLNRLTRVDKRKEKERALVQSKKMEALATMAKGLTRQFNQSLGIIGDQTERMRGVVDPNNNVLSESLQNIDHAAGALVSFSKKLDCLARGDFDPSEATFFDLKKIVKDSIALLDRKRNGKINLKTYLRSVSPIEGDPSEIRDVITSLTLNAVRAMPDGGDLYVSTEENAGHAYVYIQDNGVGIPNEIRDRIFDPCFTANGDNAVGLGLSLAYAIVKRHHGEIEIKSREDQGTTTVIKLPAAQERRKNLRAKVKRKIKDTQILIIVNDHIMRDLLSYLLGSKGFRVTEVDNSQAGFNKIQRKKFHLVIADTDTAGRNGQSIVKRVRKLSRTLPVVLITERNVENEKGITDAADLTINKPIEMNKLVASVLELLTRKETGR